MGGEEDLERYEAEMELALYHEYRDVVGMFRYLVETERRFYLANDARVTAYDEAATWFVVELEDAWVWDMYRPTRFVPHVRVRTFRDVNVEDLGEPDQGRPPFLDTDLDE